MTRHYLRVAIGLLSCVVCTLTTASATVLSPAGQAILPALFTEAQATRGQAIYERACASCHRFDLLGDAIEEVPPLVDEDFIATWGGAPLRELSDFVRKNMPGNAARSLSPRDYSDVLAYLLKANKMPAGTEELTEMTPLDRVAMPRLKDQP